MKQSSQFSELPDRFVPIKGELEHALSVLEDKRPTQIVYTGEELGRMFGGPHPRRVVDALVEMGILREEITTTSAETGFHEEDNWDDDPSEYESEIRYVLAAPQQVMPVPDASGSSKNTKPEIIRQDMVTAQLTDTRVTPVTGNSSKPEEPSIVTPEGADESAASPSPWHILKNAISAVPVVKYALGVLGIAAAFAIGRSMVGNPIVGLIAVGVMLVLMLNLFLFARLAQSSSKGIAAAGLTLIWFALILFMLSAVGLVTSVFFDIPLPLRTMLIGMDRQQNSDGKQKHTQSGSLF